MNSVHPGSAGILAYGGCTEGCHVESYPHFRPAAPDTTHALHRSPVSNPGSQTGQRRRLPTVQPPQFRHVSQHQPGSASTDALNAIQRVNALLTDKSSLPLIGKMNFVLLSSKACRTAQRKRRSKSFWTLHNFRNLDRVHARASNLKSSCRSALKKCWVIQTPVPNSANSLAHLFCFGTIISMRRT